MTSKGPFQPKTFYDTMILNQRVLGAVVLSGLGCEVNATAVEVFRLENSFMREGTTFFCPILPCFYLLSFTPGSFHSQKGSHPPSVMFIFFKFCHPLFVFSRRSCLSVIPCAYFVLYHVSSITLELPKIHVLLHTLLTCLFKMLIHLAG